MAFLFKVFFCSIIDFHLWASFYLFVSRALIHSACKTKITVSNLFYWSASLSTGQNPSRIWEFEMLNFLPQLVLLETCWGIWQKIKPKQNNCWPYCSNPFSSGRLYSYVCVCYYIFFPNALLLAFSSEVTFGIWMTPNEHQIICHF